MENPAVERYLEIGAIIFPRIDQFDFTGPFEMLPRIPNSTLRLPVVDAQGIVQILALELVGGEVGQRGKARQGQEERSEFHVRSASLLFRETVLK
jgi:hypothetical protein